MILKADLKAVFVEHKVPGRWLKQNPLKFLYLKNSKKIKTITVSNFAKQEFIKLGVPARNIEVIYPAASPSGLESRKESNNFTIGILGRLDPEKGVLEFLNSITADLVRNPSWQILIAGDGTQKKEIENLAKKYSQIKYLGFVYNLDGFFSRISVLAYPSLVPESFGIVILEAISRGIPVLASNTGAIPELIKHGENGFLINGEKEWISRLEQTSVPANYEKLSGSARESAENFSEKRMFSSFDTIISP